MGTTKLRMVVSRGGTTRERVAIFERANRVKLPEDYVRFLLEHNGGEPERAVVEYIDADVGLTNTRIACFLGLDAGDDDLEVTFRYYVEQERIPPAYLPIANDTFGNMLLLRLEPDGYGEVHFWNHEKEHLEGTQMLSPVIGSFDALIDMLQ